MKKVTYSELDSLLSDIKGRIFTAEFYKKDGSLRTLNGRLGVHKYVKGVGLKYNPEERGMITVYDLQNEGYRTLNKATLRRIKVNKEDYLVQH